MDKRTARYEIARRRSMRPDVLLDAFKQQKDFITDPAKLKAIFCTRRAAKSYTSGLYLVKEALDNPGCNGLWIGLTRASIKSIAWKDILKAINSRFKLNAAFNSTELTMTLPNGSVIKLLGVDADEDERKKLLGGKYRLVCVDEASMYTIDVRDLVYGVLKPSTVDPSSKGDRGTICLTGTSSNFTRGLFYDITTGKEQGWSVHTWTAFDNPYVAKQWAEELNDIANVRPLYMETPQFRQWYRNEWVVDEEKLVYRFNETRNIFESLPALAPNGWQYVLGVDVGWEDDNAFVVTAWHDHMPQLFVVETFNKPRMTFDQVAAKVAEFQVKYPICKIVIDGANKQGIETMRARTNIPFEFADKQGKVDFIELLNSDLIQEKVKLHRDLRVLQNEMMSLVWQTDGDKIKFPKKEHPALPNHLCDALLYAWRSGYHYNGTPATKIPVMFSDDWYKAQSEEIWEKERDKLEREQDTGWPEMPMYT